MRTIKVAGCDLGKTSASFAIGYVESDGHGGAAGFITRIQAFLQSVSQYLAADEERPLPDDSRRVSYVESGRHRGKYLDKKVRYVFFSSVDYLSDLFAAVYRS